MQQYSYPLIKVIVCSSKINTVMDNKLIFDDDVLFVFRSKAIKVVL